MDSRGYAYDFWSIMHYGPKQFSKNNKTTIDVLEKYRYLNPRIGQRKGWSYLDLAQIRSKYLCNKVPSLESKKGCVSNATKGRDYRGMLQYTENGVMCQPWNRNYPHFHTFNIHSKCDGLGKHNYCRNPTGKRKRPWCFTTLTKVEWQYCDLKICNGTHSA